MKITRAIPLIVAGVIAGIALVLSCGDDSLHNADAAVCDCPTAEPPITASRIVQIEDPFTVLPTTGGAWCCLPTRGHRLERWVRCCGGTGTPDRH